MTPDAFDIIDKLDVVRWMDGGGVELVIEPRRERLDGSPEMAGLLRRKIQFYLDQLNTEGFQAVFHHPPPEKTVIVLQCEEPPIPAVVDFVEEARPWVAQNNATLVLRTASSA